MNIWTVDAFTDRLFCGNPAAVIPVDKFPRDALCQQIAAELNLSETAFVELSAKGTLPIRWFTPKVEVKLCGHATLAAAHVLFEEGLVLGNTIQFCSHSGILTVHKRDGALTLDFPLQKTGPGLALDPFTKLFGAKLVSAVQAYDDIIIELDDASSVKALDISPGAWSQFDCRGVIVTASSGPPFDFVSRFFAPRVGVDEDPVTGSAHCKLAHYWQEKLGKSNFLAYQASPRGGEIEIEVVNDRVLLTGKAVTVLKGCLKNANF